MNKIISFMIKIVLCSLFTCQLVWADSPLTSSDFYQTYSEYSQVTQAADRNNKTLTTDDLFFLTSKSVPVGARLALINALGYEQSNKNNDEAFLSYISPNAKSYNEAIDRLLYKGTADNLVIYAYLMALNDYFDVDDALYIANQAVEKSPRSMSAQMINALIVAQQQLDGDWCDVFLSVDQVRNLPDLNDDLKPEAVSAIFEGYIDGYQEYCLVDEYEQE